MRTLEGKSIFTQKAKETQRPFKTARDSNSQTPAPQPRTLTAVTRGVNL